MIGTVGVEAAAREQVAVEDAFGLVLGPDVQDALFLLVFADLVIGVLAGVFLVGTDVDDFFGRQIVEGAHRRLAEEQGAVHINALDFFVQDLGTGLRHFDAGHLGQDVDGHFTFVDFDGGSPEDDGILIHGDRRHIRLLDRRIQLISFRPEIGYGPVFAGRDIHRMPFLPVTDHREAHLGGADRDVEKAEASALPDRGEEGVVLRGYDDDDRPDTGDFLAGGSGAVWRGFAVFLPLQAFIFFREEPDAAGDDAPVLSLESPLHAGSAAGPAAAVAETSAARSARPGAVEASLSQQGKTSKEGQEEAEKAFHRGWRNRSYEGLDKFGPRKFNPGRHILRQKRRGHDQGRNRRPGRAD